MYELPPLETLLTPSLLVFRDKLQQNVRNMLQIAGGPDRLRPHCKTHKMTQVVQLLLDQGVTRHKCATMAEAEMLAGAGVRDIFWAYPPIGANLARVVHFRKRYPNVSLQVTADDAGALQQLNACLEAERLDLEVLLDIDTGLHRTGVQPGSEAVNLYRLIEDLPALRAGGLHHYDGQHHQHDVEQRREAVLASWRPTMELRERLVSDDLPVPRIVVGGTGSFPIFAELEDPCLELSPGTCVFHDAGYAHDFPDLPFQPAALLLTRVVSRPTANRITWDLGYKACASDPPLERRVVFPDLPDARVVLQNEEHLVIESPQAERYHVGDAAVAIPWHICPTSALHRDVYVCEKGQLIDRWLVAARDRQLSI